jgi:hypothetical protein
VETDTSALQQATDPLITNLEQDYQHININDVIEFDSLSPILNNLDWLETSSTM